MSPPWPSQDEAHHPSLSSQGPSKGATPRAPTCPLPSLAVMCPPEPQPIAAQEPLQAPAPPRAPKPQGPVFLLSQALTAAPVLVSGEGGLQQGRVLAGLSSAEPRQCPGPSTRQAVSLGCGRKESAGAVGSPGPDAWLLQNEHEGLCFWGPESGLASPCRPPGAFPWSAARLQCCAHAQEHRTIGELLPSTQCRQGHRGPGSGTSPKLGWEGTSRRGPLVTALPLSALPLSQHLFPQGGAPGGLRAALKRSPFSF